MCVGYSGSMSVCASQQINKEKTDEDASVGSITPSVVSGGSLVLASLCSRERVSPLLLACSRYSLLPAPDRLCSPCHRFTRVLSSGSTFRTESV